MTRIGKGSPLDLDLASQPVSRVRDAWSVPEARLLTDSPRSRRAARPETGAAGAASAMWAGCLQGVMVAERRRALQRAARRPRARLTGGARRGLPAPSRPGVDRGAHGVL